MILTLPARRLLFFAPALLVAFISHAQPDPVKFGKIDPKDLTAEPFAHDSAEAVVLCDYGSTRFNLKGTSFQLESERITRIKILKKSGYGSATVQVPLYHQGNNEEKLTSLRGYTYNLVNGAVQKTKLESSGVFTEEVNKNVRMRKFTLPNVQEGSVIEYSYTVASDFLFNFQSWTFQREIPVRWSEYRASIPEYFDYKKVVQGYLPLTINTKEENTTQYQMHVDARHDPSTAGNQRSEAVNENITAQLMSHRWVMKDVPAFIDEPYMTTTDDYIARINFELAGEKWPNRPYQPVASDWGKISRLLLEDENFGLQLNRGNFLKDQMQALATKYPEVKDRAAAVREVVMAAVRYDGTNRYSTTGSLRRAYDAHRGTAAEVNLLLIAALRDAGIPAQPVLLSTRDHGQVNQSFAMLDKFNYVVALVALGPDKELLVDATEPLLPCGMLPERCLNQLGRLVANDDEGGRWVSLTPTQRRVRFQQVQLTLDAQGGITGKVHEEHGGYAGATARAQYTSMGEKKYWAELASQHSGWSLPKFAVVAREDVSKPLAFDYEFTQPADDNTTAGTLYLSPLREFASEQNPFRHNNRTFPVDFGSTQEEMMMITLSLPAGYELAETPKPMVVDMPDGGGRFMYSVAATGSTVQITSRMNLRKPVYAAEEYTHLQEFYRLMLTKHAEKLVIKKKV
jgi:hypothetical protein